MMSIFFFRASGGNQPTGVRSGILIPEPPWHQETLTRRARFDLRKNPGEFQPVRVYFSTKETKPRESNANVNWRGQAVWQGYVHSPSSLISCCALTHFSLKSHRLNWALGSWRPYSHNVVVFCSGCVAFTGGRVFESCRTHWSCGVDVVSTQGGIIEMKGQKSPQKIPHQAGRDGVCFFFHHILLLLQTFSNSRWHADTGHFRDWFFFKVK